jgi:GH24 family phage-related lysozyme (muramidase)
MKRRRGHHQGSLYQQRDGLWCVCFSLGKREDGRRLRRYFYARDRFEAERILRDWPKRGGIE